jgi:hypothetical protein
VSDLSGGKDQDPDDGGIQQKAEIAQKDRWRALHGMRRLRWFLRSRNDRPPTRPPVIQLRFVGVNGVVLPVSMTVNRQAFA